MKRAHGLLRILIGFIGIWMTTIPINASDTEEGVTFLFSNGKTATFAFESKPLITVNDAGFTLSFDDAESISYAFADVKRFYFEENEEGPVTGVPNVCASHAVSPVFSILNGVLSIKGLKAKESISIFSANGKVVNTVFANNGGSCRINISKLPSGVYVTSTENGVSFKLIKK